MNAQVAINIPDLEPHCEYWTVVQKDTGAMVHEFMSRFSLERACLDPDKFVVLTRHQYLLKLNDHSVAQIGAKNLLEQIETRGLAGDKKYTELASALKAFIK